jgi:hypothetical protein
MRRMGRERAGRGAKLVPGVGSFLGVAAFWVAACSSGGPGSGQPTSGGTSPTADGSGVGGGSGTGGSTGSASGSGGGSSGGASSGVGSSGSSGSNSSSGGSGAAGLDASGGSDGTGNPGPGDSTTGSAGEGGGSGAAGADSGGAGSGATEAGGEGGPPITDLFNGTDLTGFVAYSQTSKTTPGTLLTGTAATALFKPENGMIHVYGDLADQSAQPLGMLQTTASYTKFNLSWDYKWGTKKFAPYTDLTSYPRDAGLLWAIHGDKTQVWPSSIEFQNKWGSTGDIFALFAQCKSLGAANDSTTYAAGGTAMTVNGSTGYVQHHRSADWEMMGDGGASSTGAGTDWNSCLLQVDTGTAVYTVNGHIVNQVLAVMDKTGTPVTSGPIAWQAESAEVYYRNLRIQVFR